MRKPALFKTLPLVAACLAGTAWAAPAATLSPAQFEAQLMQVAAPLAGKEVAGLQSLYLSWGVGPWLDTGIDVKAGDDLTLVLNGGVDVSRTYKISYSPELATWARIGDQGPIFRGLRDTNTFKADRSGRLQLKLHPRDRWLDVSGRYRGEPPAINPDEGGGVNVGVIRWAPKTDIRATLGRMASGQPASHWTRRELTRQQTPRKPLPAGWQELWELAPSDVFGEITPARAAQAPAKAIHLHTRDDVSILQKNAAMPLTAGTTLGWKWKVDKLPSPAPENHVPTHDYISIAVEFDNGRDLTFYWSRDLAEGTHFHCPLPGWHDRETHVVVRSGTADLGKWLNEEKNIMEHYKKAIGGELPKRITKVWLIGVSLFQHGEGEAAFSDIVLKDGKTEKRVY